VAPLVVLDGVPNGLHGEAYVWLAVAGLGNVVGLLSAYAGLRAGKVGVVAPIVSTQGAIAAVIAVVGGEQLAPGSGVLLAVIAVGVFIAGMGSEGEGEAVERQTGRATLFAIGAAMAIGLSLYAIGRVSVSLTVAWALLPSRALGFVGVTVPLALRSELRLTREALPFVLVASVFEVAGFALFALGARHGIAVAAVLSSLFAAIAAVAAYFLFRERLTGKQAAGVGLVVAAVAALSGLRA